MNNEDIIKHIVSKYGKVNSTVMREKDKYVVKVMKPYSGGSGIGYMGAMNVLDINFNTEHSANKLNELIRNVMRLKK